jgi:hypothetical protein
MYCLLTEDILQLSYYMYFVGTFSFLPLYQNKINLHYLLHFVNWFENGTSHLKECAASFFRQHTVPRFWCVITKVSVIILKSENMNFYCHKYMKSQE